jgi:hypothetical protein
MQNIENFTESQKRERLSKLLGEDSVALSYGGPDLPDGHIGSTTIVGRIISVGVAQFIFEFENGETAPLTISDVLAI